MFQLTLGTPLVLPCFPFKNNFNTVAIAKKNIQSVDLMELRTR